jgi:hypothetical protein
MAFNSKNSGMQFAVCLIGKTKRSVIKRLDFVEYNCFKVLREGLFGRRSRETQSAGSV